ncbi:MAG: LptA/OstA family protein [Sphingomonadaceae bacterium]
MSAMRIMVCLFAAMLATPLEAQSLRGHNTNAPVDVAADRIEVQDRANRAVFSGDVRVTQGGLELASTRLTVAYSGSAGAGSPQIQRLDATGGVTVRSASENARGDFAIYDLNRRLITVLGNVVLNQGPNTVRGARLVIDLTSGRSVIDGSAVGGTPGVSGSGGRVTGRFTVPQRN